ncbi:MAG TPA: crosslink repair DNA glycosylase YcaQ family protein [Thermodesulfobacteriota bacterium]
MPSPVSLSLDDARALALAAQGFDRRPARPGPGRLAALLVRLGAVQLDSVNVVARSHELAVYSRLGAYRPADLHRVAYRRRAVFEYWGHAASWLPMAEYRWFLPRMFARRERPRGWWAEVRERYGHLAAPILARIRDEGPLTAAAFEDERKGRGSWWDWKPAKLVLEDLFDQGLLMVADRRHGFQRVYDLAERVLPPDVDTRPPSAAESAAHLVARAAAALGVATARDLADYFRLPPHDTKPALAALVEAGRLVPARVEGWRQPAYLPAEAFAVRPRRPRHPPVLLSPFDSLVWTRDRTARLFGFDFAIEIYTPEAKRRYGYYVLPLLVDGRLVGRADVKHERADGTLVAAAIHLEPGCPAGTAEAMGRALADLAAFVGARRVHVHRAEPARALGAVRAAAARAAEVQPTGRRAS